MDIKRQNSLKEYVLKCPICYEFFSIIHKPLIIPCGHTMCSICCENLKKISSEEDDEEYHSEMDADEFDISLDTEEEEQNDRDDEDDDEEESSHMTHQQTNPENDEEDLQREEEPDNEIILEREDEDHHVMFNLTQNENSNVSGAASHPQIKKFKLKCSICRQKMRIYENEILFNKDVMSIVEAIEHKNKINEMNTQIENLTLTEEKKIKEIIGIKIFCKVCRKVDTDINHLSIAKFHHHQPYFIQLTDEKLSEIKKNIYTDIKSDITDANENDNFINIFYSLEPLEKRIKSILNTFITSISNSQEILSHGREYIKNYFYINSKPGYLKNKSFKKLSKLYMTYEKLMEEISNAADKSHDHDEEFNFKDINTTSYNKAEICLDRAETLCNKYFKLMELYINNYDKLMNDNHTENNIREILPISIKDKTMKLFHDGLLESFINGIFDYERRYISTIENSGDNTILIYDFRLDSELQVYYKNVFEKIIEERKGEDGFTEEKLFTQNVEIDETGRFIFFLGKKDKNSKIFWMYDMKVRELIKKPDMPEKFNIVDRYFYKGKLFIIGGSLLDETSIQSCYYYNVESDWWENLPSLTLKRTSKSIAVIDNKIYAIGGTLPSNTSDTSIIQKFECLDLNKLNSNSNSWEVFSIKDFNYPGQNYLYGFISSNYFVILGGEDTSTYEEYVKGFLINVCSRELVEEFKLKNSAINSFNVCGYYRGLLVGSSMGAEYFNRINLRNNLIKLITIVD